MINAIHRLSLPGALPTSNPFAGSVTGVLLVLNFVRALHIVAVVCAALATADIAHAQWIVDSFNPGANDTVRAVMVQADGKILVGGDFTTLGGGGTGTTTRNYLGRLNADGSLDTNFNPGANGAVWALALQADGKILVGGTFTGLGGAFDTGFNPRSYIGRLNANGSLDTNFNPGADDSVFALVVQPDGKILVVGDFSTLGAAPRYRIGRLGANGSPDGFNPGANDKIWAVAMQADGKVWVGGDFRLLGGGGPFSGSGRNRIGRLNADGSLDASVGGNDGVISRISALAVQPDGKILVGGEFTALGFGGGLIGSAPRNNIGRLNANGSLDTNFNPGANGLHVDALVVQPDGKILVGGFFYGLGGGTGTTTRNHIGRLNADGSVDTNFNPGANSTVDAMAVQADGKVLVAGSFTTLGGGGTGTTTRNYIGRLTVVPPSAPAVTTHPSNQTVTAGATVSFTATASGLPSPTVQWQVSTNSGSTFTGISGATVGTYSFVAGAADNGKRFRAVFSNSLGSVTSSVAVLTVNAPAPGTVVAWGYNGDGQTTVPAGLNGVVTAIAAGGNHTVAVKTNGTVVAWGYNADGQTTVPAGLSGVTAIAAGEGHTVALKSDGTVVAWGDNSDGQTAVPAGLSEVTAIAAGNYHTVALKKNGTVVAWGLGLTIAAVPAGLSGVTAIAAGFLHTVALKNDGTVVAWGFDSDGQMTVPAGLSEVTAIAARAFHTVALKKNGTVVTWGGASRPDNFGQTTVPAGLSGVTAIAVGFFHTVALKNDGTVVAWGFNMSGPTTTPASLSGVTAIAAGNSHTVALVGGTGGAALPVITAQPSNVIATAASTVTFTVRVTGTAPLSYQWRNGRANVAGATNASLTLSNVQTNQNGTSYAVVITNTYGSVTSSTAVLRVNEASPGTVVAWGDDRNGQTTVPAGLSEVMAIATGDEYTAALKADGTVVAWGYNQFGQTTAPAGLSGVTAIAAGDYHTVALKSNGTVAAWGYNFSGQSTIPAGLSGVTAIAAGVYHTVALKTNGTVVAWGYNQFGQTTVPADLSGVTAIAAGDYHTVALKSDGTVVAWGFDSDGQTTVPPSLNGVTTIAAGDYHTVALKSDGTVVAWGENSDGRTTIPADLSGVSAIAAGRRHTVALKRNGTVVAWGYNGSGRTTVPAGLRGVSAIAAGNNHTVALFGKGVVVPAVAPTVTARSTGNNLTLLWPDSATGYRAESILSLSPPLTWSNVAGSFQTNGGSISIVLPITGGQTFYRLVKP